MYSIGPLADGLREYNGLRAEGEGPIPQSVIAGSHRELHAGDEMVEDVDTHAMNMYSFRR